MARVARNEERASDEAHRIADLRRNENAEAEQPASDAAPARDRAAARQEEAEREEREVNRHVQTARDLTEEAHARAEESRRQVAEYEADRAAEEGESGPGNG